MAYRNNGAHDDVTLSVEPPPSYVPDPFPYPGGNPLAKWAFKAPLVLWRLGLGRVVGWLFLVLTTTGRKSGLPRHTALEYHRWQGRLYVFSAWGARAQWVKNLEAEPRVTVQTARGTRPMHARRVTGDGELLEAFALVERVPTMRQWLRLLGMEVTREDFLRHRDRYYLLTFDPVEDGGPAPLPVDLWWVWGPVALFVAALIAGLRRAR